MQFSFTTKRRRFQMTWERLPKPATTEAPQEEPKAVVSTGTYRHPGNPSHSLGFTTPAVDRKKRLT